MNTYNIYCDESCHLEYDDSDIMVLGAIMCNKELTHRISEEIRAIKVKHGLSRHYELKWTKISMAKIDFYREIIDYFFNNHELHFRGFIATGKKELNNQLFNQTYDEWYYKMYFLLLNRMLDPQMEYCIYIDIKDTNGGAKVAKLQTILNNCLYSFSQTCVKKLQIIKSHESEILQLSDLLIGAISFKNRFLALSKYNVKNPPSLAKIKLCEYIMLRSGVTLEHKTPKSETKFNIFVWEPR